MRDNTISICKGIGIILMVVGHAGSPSFIGRFIYCFHMPLFFIASGYFFSTKYLDDKFSFVKKRVKGLYIPFVKWGLIFLLLHNLLFNANILNASFGGSYLYSFNQILDKGFHIITTMGSYEPAILGTFWFLRSLFVASIVFCLLFYLIDKLLHLKHVNTAIIICLMAFVAGFIMSFKRINLPYIPQGGIREIYGLFYIGVGFLFRNSKMNSKLKYDNLILMFSFIIICLLSYFNPTSLSTYPKLKLYLGTFIPAIVGWIMTYKFSSWFDNVISENIIYVYLKKSLLYLGEHTMPIIVFHFLSFKIVSLIKVTYYGYSPLMVGCHPVISYNNGTFWVYYSIVGLIVPLLLDYLFSKTKYLRFLSFK
jgi:fucose 4-O-acetylase-like acetyltransferase